MLSEHGKRLASFAGRAFAWSPRGDRLASLAGQTLTVRGAGGVGRVSFRKKASGTAQVLFWADAHRVVLVNRLNAQYDGIDVSSGRSWKPSERLVSAHYCGCTSPDGSLVADTTRAGDGFALRVARLDASHARTLIRVPSCTDDGVLVPSVQSVQFATARSVVYQSRCAEPPVDLYSVDPNGGAARAITRTSAEETEPALSPDGTQVAYVRADARGFSCKGCPATIWIMNADGTNQHALTQPQNGQWDYDPSWSPDGTQIVFSRWYSGRRGVQITSSSSMRQAAPPGISASSARARPGGRARSHTSRRALLSTAVPSGASRRTGRVGARSRQANRPICRHGRVEASSPTSISKLGRTGGSGRGRTPGVGAVREDRRPRRGWPTEAPLSSLPQRWTPGRSGRLVYDVYTVRPDGSGIKRLTTNVSGWPR